MIKILVFLATIFFTTSAYAGANVAVPDTSDKTNLNKAHVKMQGVDDKAEAHKNDVDSERAKYQKIADEYKKYLMTVKKEVREEITNFRKDISKINKQKRDAYKALSQEAQHYLAKERELKRKLPKDQYKLLEDDQDSE